MKIFLILFFFVCNAFAGTESSVNCADFNKAALQISLSKNKINAPLDFIKLQQILGKGKLISDSVITTYSWIYKDRVLLVKTDNANIVGKLLTGKGDGSSDSHKMERIYEKLKYATSIWTIKEIQQQLGSGYISTSDVFQEFEWTCGYGTMSASVKQSNNELLVAKIIYSAPSADLIEEQINYIKHPKWDIETTSVYQAYRSWERVYKTL